jgi:hypothetical protein
MPIMKLIPGDWFWIAVGLALVILGLRVGAF